MNLDRASNFRKSVFEFCMKTQMECDKSKPGPLELGLDLFELANETEKFEFQRTNETE